jgi:hypothetical protein
MLQVSGGRMGLCLLWPALLLKNGVVCALTRPPGCVYQVLSPHPSYFSMSPWGWGRTQMGASSISGPAVFVCLFVCSAVLKTGGMCVFMCVCVCVCVRLRLRVWGWGCSLFTRERVVVGCTALPLSPLLGG